MGFNSGFKGLIKDKLLPHAVKSDEALAMVITRL